MTLTQIADRAKAATPLKARMLAVRLQVNRLKAMCDTDSPSHSALHQMSLAAIKVQDLLQNAIEERDRLNGDV